MTTDGDTGETGSTGEAKANQLGEFIRVQRRMADLSLRRMADLTQVSNAYLSQIERGLHQPSLRVLQSIADALDVSAETLLAQAGMRETPERERAEREATGRETPDQEGGGDEAAPTVLDTEAAIAADPALTPENRETLLRVYRSMRSEA